jgi:hypothetical protein
MKPKIKTKQLLALTQILKNLKEFNEKGFGNILNIDVLTYVPEKGSVFIKYEKSYSDAGEMAYDYRIAKIDKDGVIDFIDNKFKDMFERSAFLSECVSFNIEDKNSYEKID